jgi:predicted dehydrogenase
MWLGPAQMRPYNSILSPRGVHKHFPDWRKYREFGGGMVTDWGAHHFDIAQWGLGMDESGPVEIIPPQDEKATHGVKLVYANGVEVIHTDGNGVTFIGSEGEIYVNRGQFKATPSKLGDEPLAENAVHLYDSKDHKADWLSSIRSRKPPICDVPIGAHTVTVCHLVNLAYYHHQRLKWDPSNQKFVGGTGNKVWLDRQYRGSWKLA